MNCTNKNCDIEDKNHTCFRNAKWQLHREDGPAVIFPAGEQYWYQNGKRHRDDGPAVIWPNTSQHWYQNGLLHREDGPAVILFNEIKAWWIDGEQIL